MASSVGAMFHDSIFSTAMRSISNMTHGKWGDIGKDWEESAKNGFGALSAFTPNSSSGSGLDNSQGMSGMIQMALNQRQDALSSFISFDTDKNKDKNKDPVIKLPG